jgi:hypothetical protein
MDWKKDLVVVIAVLGCFFLGILTMKIVMDYKIQLKYINLDSQAIEVE